MNNPLIYGFLWFGQVAIHRSRSGTELRRNENKHSMSTERDGSRESALSRAIHQSVSREAMDLAAEQSDDKFLGNFEI